MERIKKEKRKNRTEGTERDRVKEEVTDKSESSCHAFETGSSFLDPMYNSSRYICMRDIARELNRASLKSTLLRRISLV